MNGMTERELNGDNENSWWENLVQKKNPAKLSKNNKGKEEHTGNT